MASLEWEKVYGGKSVTPDDPSKPVVPDVPELPTDVSYKIFTEDFIFLTTAENIASFISDKFCLLYVSTP